jgi:hypothetical protein
MGGKEGLEFDRKSIALSHREDAVKRREIAVQKREDRANDAPILRGTRVQNQSLSDCDQRITFLDTGSYLHEYSGDMPTYMNESYANVHITTSILHVSPFVFCSPEFGVVSLSMFMPPVNMDKGPCPQDLYFLKNMQTGIGKVGIQDITDDDPGQRFFVNSVWCPFRAILTINLRMNALVRERKYVIDVFDIYTEFKTLPSVSPPDTPASSILPAPTGSVCIPTDDAAVPGPASDVAADSSWALGNATAEMRDAWDVFYSKLEDTEYCASEAARRHAASIVDDACSNISDPTSGAETDGDGEEEEPPDPSSPPPTRPRLTDAAIRAIAYAQSALHMSRYKSQGASRDGVFCAMHIDRRAVGKFFRWKDLTRVVIAYRPPSDDDETTASNQVISAAKIAQQYFIDNKDDILRVRDAFYIIHCRNLRPKSNRHPTYSNVRRFCCMAGGDLFVDAALPLPGSPPAPAPLP